MSPVLVGVAIHDGVRADAQCALRNLVARKEFIMRGLTSRNDDAAVAGRVLSAQLRTWAPSPQDIAWLAEQITLRADDWARLARAVADDEDIAPCFDPRWHD